ncbi:MAG TPA: cobalamin-binding protein [Eubacteriaceae bacterium]|nr:cobalamin-binding protein [Eubacteriaceae bacterium]
MYLKKLTESVGNLEEDQVIEALRTFTESDPDKDEVNQVVDALQSGMTTVGDRFAMGEYFVGDLIFAGEILAEAIDILKPFIVSDPSKTIGVIVLGTVKGDLHDLGKNIFKSMAQAEGFEVHDIGIDQPVEHFIQKIKEVKPDILGLSGVLTLAIDAMKDTVAALEEEGVREDIKVIIGGNPVTKEAARHIGADAYTTNATEGVRICKEWITEKNNQ